MSRFIHAGISIDVPPGWEASARGGSFQLLPSGAREPTVVHVATFPLPVNGASFGGDSVESMGSTDILIVLFEYGPGTAPPFASTGVPHLLHPRQFDRNALQRTLPGQSGLQHFFTVGGRTFCLYVVLGSHIDRADLVRKVNGVLATLEIH